MCSEVFNDYEDEERFDYDGFWKDLIEVFWREMLQAAIPDLYEAADLSQEPEFLSKELRDTIFIPENSGHNPAQFIDELLNIALKAGGSAWVLLHIEIQGQGGSDISARMFNYFCLIASHYKRYPAGLVILTAPRPSRETPGEFEVSQYGTSVIYRYNVIDLWSLRDDELLEGNNPFKFIMYAARKALSSRKNEMQKFVYLKELRKLLQFGGWGKEESRVLLLFIERIMNLRSKTLRVEYDEFVADTEGGKRMPYESWIEKSFHDKGLAEGIAEGRAEGKAEERKNLLEAAKRLLAENMSLSKVAEIMRLTPAEVASLSAGL